MPWSAIAGAVAGGLLNKAMNKDRSTETRTGPPEWMMPYITGGTVPSVEGGFTMRPRTAGTYRFPGSGPTATSAARPQGPMGTRIPEVMDPALLAYLAQTGMTRPQLDAIRLGVNNLRIGPGMPNTGIPPRWSGQGGPGMPNQGMLPVRRGLFG